MRVRAVVAVPCRGAARRTRVAPALGLSYPFWLTCSPYGAGLLILELFHRLTRMYEQMPKEASRYE